MDQSKLKGFKTFKKTQIKLKDANDRTSREYVK